MNANNVMPTSLDSFEKLNEKHKQLEDELRKTNKALSDVKILMSAVFNQSPIPLAVVRTTDAVLLAVNPACQKILGLDGDLVGKSLAQVKPEWKTFTCEGDEVALKNLPLARVMRGETIAKEVMRIERKDGSSRWVEVSSSLIYDLEGNQMAAQVAFPDITERKQAEETIKEKMAELEKIIAVTIGREVKMADLKKELRLAKSKNSSTTDET